MPELPEVETTRRGLLPHVTGTRITATQVHRRDLRMQVPSRLEKAIEDAEILTISRRSKYLLFHLNTAEILLIHLGMSGSVRLEKPGFALKKHDHVVWELSNQQHMVFHDPRRFGVITLFSQEESNTHPLLKKLGPEPFSKEFNASYVQQALARRKGPIKPTLMDAKFVVGVGNIYASESLFSCCIHPDTPAHSLTKKQCAALVKSVQTTLQAAIHSGGSTLRDYVQSTGNTGYFQHSFAVYGRDGVPCLRCGDSIVHKVHAGRATYWCNSCQPYHP